MIRKALLLLVIFLLSSHQPLYAERATIIQTDYIVVVFEEPLRVVAKDAVNIYPKLKSDIENILNWPLDFRPTVVLTTNRERFEEMSGSTIVVAYAVPQRNLMVIDYSKMNTDPFSLATIMKHELCHLLLHNQVKNGKLPRWLDEGISQLVSDGVAEIMMSRKRSILDRAVLSKKLLSMRRLSGSFPRDTESLLLAYEESKSIVEFIHHEFGREGIQDLLGHMRAGYEIDAAVLKSFSVPFDELERRWHIHLRKKITWFTYLANNLYGILFFFAALITIAGFVRLMIKKRRYGEDESAQSS